MHRAGVALVCEAANAAKCWKAGLPKTTNWTPAPAGDQEQQALELIARMREEVWDLPESDLQLGFDALNSAPSIIVRAIGAIYHPKPLSPSTSLPLGYPGTGQARERPASRLASTIPIKYIGDRN